MPKYANIFGITMAAVPTNLIVLLVTYNSDRAKLGSDTKRGRKLQTDGRLWPYAEDTDKSRLWLTNENAG